MGEEHDFSSEKKEESLSGAICNRNSIMKCLFIGLVIFLGAFCAFYVVADWHFKSMIHYEKKRFSNQVQNLEEQSALDYILQKEKRTFQKFGEIIHMQKSNDEYKIIIDLRAFDNNVNNLKVTVKGNILSIIGRTISVSKNDEQISEFQQSYLFGENVNLANISKETIGNYYVITLPIMKKERLF